MDELGRRIPHSPANPPPLQLEIILIMRFLILIEIFKRQKTSFNVLKRVLNILSNCIGKVVVAVQNLMPLCEILVNFQTFF